MIVVEQLLGKGFHDVTLATQVEHFEGFQMPKKIEFPVHHVEHASVDHLELVFDS